MRKRKIPQIRLTMLKYNHWGAILSTASQLGINPTDKRAIIKTEGTKLEVLIVVCLIGDLAMLVFSLLNCNINLFTKIILNKWIRL